jgi:hypothetical protein
MDPPGQMQARARHIGPRVQVLNFLLRFSMGNFKNRLAAKNHAQLDRTPSQASPKAQPGPLGAPGRSHGPRGAYRSSVRGRGWVGVGVPEEAGDRIPGAGQGGRGLTPGGDATPRRHTARRLACPLCSPPLHKPTGPFAEARSPDRTEGPGSELFFVM